MEKSEPIRFRRKVGPKEEIIIPKIFIRKEENFIEWLEDRAREYRRNLSKVNLKEIMNPNFEEKLKNSIYASLDMEL